MHHHLPFLLLHQRQATAVVKVDRLKDGDDDDEGYCGSAASLSSRLALTDENASVFLRSLLSNLPSVIQEILSNAMFPRNSYGHGNEEVSTQATDISAGHSRFRWENRGVQGSVKEAPFLFESGPLSITVLLSLLTSRFQCSNTYPCHIEHGVKPDCLTFNQFQGHFAKELRQQFIRDLLLMRLGVQSRQFKWKLSSDSAGANSGPLLGCTAYLQGCFVYLGDRLEPQSLGISAGALCHCLSTQLKAGTQFRHLKWLTTASGSRQSGGAIRQAFLSGLDTWLRAYEAGLQTVLVSVEQPLQTVQPAREQVSSSSAASASFEPGILSVVLRLRTLTSHIDFVASHLCGLSVPSCHCQQPEHQHEAQDAESLLQPTTVTLLEQHGIGLLMHLYRQVEEVIADPLEATVRFLFKRACRPFIFFLRRLLVDGVYHEDGEEFNLVIAPKYLAKRNIAFWTKAFTFKITVTDTNNPQATGFHGLLSEQFERDILRCAKSVCLLKSVAPKHFLFQCRRFFPSLDFPDDAQGVQSNSATLANYLRLVAESARSLEATRCQRLAKEEFNRKELIRRAAETRAMKLLLIQAENDRSSEARRTKQLALHAELKEAMDQAAETKRLAQEAGKASDRALMQEDAHRRAHEESVLAEARLQLTSQYAKLIEQADVRRVAAEQRANGTFYPVVSGGEGTGASGGRQCNADPRAVEPTGDNWRQPANRQAEGDSHVDGDGGVGLVDACDRPEAGVKEENLAGLREATNTCLLNDTAGLNLLRTRLQQVDVGACQPNDILCPSSDDLQSLTAAEAHPGRHTKGDHCLPLVRQESAYEAVARFRSRNRFGHASNATAQQMLYGPGSGPTCRPSAWAAYQEEYELRSRERVQPDAVDFYRETLEESPCLVPPLTMALPDLSKLTHLEPSHRLLPLLLANSKQSPEEVSASDSTSKRSQKKEAVMERHLPLQLLLGKIVLSPLSHYIKQVDSAIVHHMIYKLQLMQHLQCLQQLFLLQNGAFSHLLLNSGLFAESSPPVGHWQAVVSVQSTETTDHLRHLMQSALAKLNAHSEEGQSDELGSDEPVPTSTSPTCCFQLPRGTAVSLTVGSRRTTDSDESGVGDPWGNPFAQLSLIYRAPWPVNLCLHPAVLAKYNRVFTLLVHLKFAVDRLASAYRLLRLRQRQRRGKQTSRGSTAEAADSHQVSLWLFELLQVVTGIEAYIANQVASSGWARLRSRLTSEDLSLETLCRFHETYVDELLTSCLLTGSDRDIPGLLHSLLACAHRFHQLALVDGHPVVVGGGPTEWAQLKAVHSTFRRHAHFLRRRSARLASSCTGAATGQLGHLIDFAFGANDFYATGSPTGDSLPYY